MQGLARFSLVAVIVLTAILLGSWAYLTARYGSIEEFMRSEDGPYWRPGSPSEAHDDLETDEGRSLTERTADSVKAGKIPEDDDSDWRKSEPEKAPSETERVPKGGDAAPKNTIEARIDTEYSDLAIDTEDETLTRNSTKSSLRPFFARTRPNTSARSGYTDDRSFDLVSSKGANSPELQELQKAGYTLIRGKVVDNQKLKGVENVVVAPVTLKGELSALRAVTNGDGEFLLYLMENEAKECGATAREARLCVVADGRNPVASRQEKYQFNSEADSNGEHLIKLEKSRGLRVRVRVTNPRSLEDAVRVWCELRDESGPAFDDHVFMSVIAPAQGDIVFRLPRGHLGVVRVGACGNGWAADAVETNKPSKDIVAVSLTLRPARTGHCSGLVCANWFEDGAAGNGVPSARVAATGTTDITYTAEDGRFEFYARKESDVQLLRISTVHGFARTYSLEPRQKSDEERAMVRSQFDAKKQAYEWQLLIPEAVTLVVALDSLQDGRDSMRLHTLAPPSFTPKLTKGEWSREEALSGVYVSSGTLEYSFKFTPWGVSAVGLYKVLGLSKMEPIATYTCGADFWESAEVVLTYPPGRSRCVVTVRMPVTRN